MAFPPCMCKGLGESLSLPLLTRTPVLWDEGPTLITSHNLYYLLIGLPPMSAGGCRGKDTMQSLRVDKEIWKWRLHGSLCLGGRGKGSAEGETWGKSGTSSGFLLCLVLTS